MRSLSRYAVRHCEIPVLVVRAEEGPEVEMTPEAGEASETASQRHPGFAV
jgi:hypothetical protein